jgi:hypothetical protein
MPSTRAPFCPPSGVVESGAAFMWRDQVRQGGMALVMREKARLPIPEQRTRYTPSSRRAGPYHVPGGSVAHGCSMGVAAGEFSEGREVLIKGLVSAPEHNGKKALVEAWLPEEKCYAVRAGVEVLFIKLANLHGRREFPRLRPETEQQRRRRLAESNSNTKPPHKRPPAERAVLTPHTQAWPTQAAQKSIGDQWKEEAAAQQQMKKNRAGRAQVKRSAESAQAKRRAALIAAATVDDVGATEVGDVASSPGALVASATASQQLLAEPEELLRQLAEVSAELARREAQLETEPEPEPELVTVRAAVHQVQWWEPTPVLISRAGDRSDGTAVKGVGAPDKQAAVYRHLRAIKEL